VTYISFVIDHLLEKKPSDIDGYLFLNAHELIVPDSASREAIVVQLEKEAKRRNRTIVYPTITTFLELASRISGVIVEDTLVQSRILFDAYAATYKEATFESFYPVGQIFLADFNDIDSSLQDVGSVFRLVGDTEELDALFSAYLSEEEKELIKEFWRAIPKGSIANEGSFLNLFHLAPSLYQRFTEALSERGRGHFGFCYKVAARLCQEMEFEFRAGRALNSSVANWENLCFIGLGMLNKAQEYLLKIGVTTFGSTIVDEPIDEQGLPAYAPELSAIKRPFDKVTKYLPATPLANEAPVGLLQANGTVAMAKLLGNLLNVILQDRKMHGSVEIESEEVVKEGIRSVGIVLGEASQLKAVLSALPLAIGPHVQVSVTGSFLESATYTLLRLCRGLHDSRTENSSGVSFKNDSVLPVLEHPIVQALNLDAVSAIRRLAYRSNQIYIRHEAILEIDSPLIKALFTFESEEVIGQYFRNVLKALLQLYGQEGVKAGQHKDQHALEMPVGRLMEESTGSKEAGFALGILTRLENITENLRLNFRHFWYLYSRTLGGAPYTIESTQRGVIQIVLLGNTQRSAFDTVIFFGVNEGQFPRRAPSVSFIAQKLRLGFGLPTNLVSLAQQGYLFARLGQQAKQVYLIENTADTDFSSAQKSRYLYQFENRGVVLQSYKVESAGTSTLMPEPIVIEKDAIVMEKLGRYLRKKGEVSQGVTSPLYPTAITNYLICPLRFYYTHIEHIEGKKSISEDVDAATFGNIIHNTMSALYGQLAKQKGESTVVKPDFDWLLANAAPYVRSALASMYSINEANYMGVGYTYISREVAEKLVFRLLEIDKERVPFTIRYNESDEALTQYIELPDLVGIEVAMKGKFDRVDIRKQGSQVVIEVLDYKTGGSVSTDVKDLKNLFEPNKPVNKEAFQILLYAWLLAKDPEFEGKRIHPIMIAIRQIMNRAYDMQEMGTFVVKVDKAQYEEIADIAQISDTFGTLLIDALTELFNPEIPFVQTTVLKNCANCTYSYLCHRA
jgi:hypothetical protein